MPYKSPIEIITQPFASQIEDISKQMQEHKETYVFQYLEKIGVNVDKEELIKALQYDRHQYEKGYKDGYDDGCSNDKWISVDDRLPENHEAVLCFYEYYRYGNYNRMFPTYGIGYCINGTWGGEVATGVGTRVIAWQPLPDVPKGCETDER